jgi:hypothetical protein
MHGHRPVYGQLVILLTINHKMVQCGHTRLERISYISEARIDGIQKMLCGTAKAEGRTLGISHRELPRVRALGIPPDDAETFMTPDQTFQGLECMVRMVHFERLG